MKFPIDPPIFLAFILGIFVGVYLQSLADEAEPSLTCEIAETKIWAMQQCLRNQPSCPKGGVEMIIEYYQMKNFVVANCPDSASGLQLD